MVKIARLTLILFAALIVASGSLVYAQQPAPTTNQPRYLVNILSREIDASNRLNVEISVSNVGNATPDNALVELLVIDSGGARPVASATVGALAFAAQARLTVSASLAEFPAQSRQVFDFRVLKSDGRTLADFATSGQFSETIPGGTGGAGDTQLVPVPTPITSPETATEQIGVDGAGGGGENVPASAELWLNEPIIIRIPLPGDDLLLDLGKRQDVALFVGIGGGLIVMLWLVSVLLRLLFRRPPSFGLQQPPYASMPPLHPQSISGIRQAWQQVAQNNAITVAPTQGAATAVKRLIGSDGRYLSGWRITALRLSQYDQYGRVGRSQLIPSRKIVRQIDRMTRKSQQLDPKRLARRTRPLGRKLARQFVKRVTKRSAMLPIALDVRLIGTHGEVNIVFEVYGCQQGAWSLLDQWLPEMTVTTKTIYESYTYTLYGQTGGESFRDFKRRLPDDLARALALLIEARPLEVPTPQPAASPITGEADSGAVKATGTASRQPIVDVSTNPGGRAADLGQPAAELTPASSRIVRDPSRDSNGVNGSTGESPSYEREGDVDTASLPTALTGEPSPPAPGQYQGESDEREQ